MYIVRHYLYIAGEQIVKGKVSITSDARMHKVAALTTYTGAPLEGKMSMKGLNIKGRLLDSIPCDNIVGPDSIIGEERSAVTPVTPERTRLQVGRRRRSNCELEWLRSGGLDGPGP